MDPCGMFCDLIRRPYKTKARLFRDSEEEVDIAWYFAEPDAKRLPFPTPITVGNLSKLPHIKTSVGQVLFADCELMKPNAIAPKPPGEHYHGTEEDFRQGCLYLPDDPPLPRADDGIPLACRPADELAVGFQGVWPSGWEGTTHPGALATINIPMGGSATTVTDCAYLKPTTFGPNISGLLVGFGAASRTYRLRLLTQDAGQTLLIRTGTIPLPVSGYSSFGPAASYDITVTVPTSHNVIWFAVDPGSFVFTLNGFFYLFERLT